MTDFLKIVQVVHEKTSIFDKIRLPKKGKDLVIVIGTDRGLCGSLNNKLFKQLFQRYETHKENTDMFCIGKKTVEFFVRSGFSVVGNQSIKDAFTEEDLYILYTFISVALQKKAYRSITLYFNFFKNAMQQLPLHVNLFPLGKENVQTFLDELDINLDEFLTPEIEYKDLIVEPSAKMLAREIQQQLIQHIVYGAILQNKTGEFASRMIAMKNAKENSISMIKSLKLSFNKARQTAITQEVSEIMSAKMAIEG